MIYVLTFWECLIFIIGLGIGTLIFRMVAKESEWDESYKTAFFVVFISTLNSILLFLIPTLIGLGLSSLGVFHNLLFLVLIVIYVVMFVLSLYFDVLIIKRFYSCDFKESFSMLRLYYFYNIIIMIPITPILLGFL